MPLVPQSVRRFAVNLTDKLPAPRDEAARQLLRSTRDLVEGRRPAPEPARKKPAAAPAAARGPKLFAVPGSYNSPIVDVSEVRGNGSDGTELVDLPGIELGTAQHDAVWADWLPHALRWVGGTPAAPRRYHADNNMFGPFSATLLAAAIGAIKPRRYVEIGSGFSSAVVLDVNDEQRPDNPIECTFIDPFPQRLQSILRPEDHEHCTILVEKVQEVDLAVFDQLEAGDVLFIDSSHIAKSGSDLVHEICEVLPRLKPGVFIHFHDILYPFDYPLKWSVKQNRSWNEPYFLRAFLMYNTDFSIHFWGDYHSLFGTPTPELAVPRSSSLWLRRS